MNYIVFDLEFNQNYTQLEEERKILSSKCPFEIIQLGAVKLNENLDTISTFNRLVKPTIYTSLHPYVEKMTGITIETLNMAESFHIAYKEFIEFIKSDRSVLCVWGAADIKELFRNFKYYKFHWGSVPNEYMDIQRQASKYFGCPKGTSIGLSKAVELLNIPFSGKFHDAFSDACYTAEVFRSIDRENIKINTYAPYSSLNRSRTVKQHINFNKLYKQLEKMYSREMSSEEKSIIKMAYMMGRTNQFSE